MPMRTRSPRLLGLALLTAVFLAGSLFGMAMNRTLLAEEAPAAGDAACEHRGGKILDQLELSPSQRTEVDRILERRRAQTEAFWDSAGPRLRALTDTTRAEIRAVLTPAQAAEYDRLRAERRAAKEAERARDAERSRDAS